VAFPLPINLAGHLDEPALSRWIGALPASLDALEVRWSLQVAAPFQPGGRTAWVAPAHSARYGKVVLKMGYRHYEAFDEANGLRHWGGEGTVRLFDAVDLDESTTALLLERCRPGSALSSVPEEVQDRVIAGLLRRLWKSPPLAGAFRPLQQMCDQWADGCEQRFGERPPVVDPGIVQEGIALFRSLPAGAERHVLLCTDLHAGNVLAAEREPWLVIDPKPYVGDPTYDVLQHLLNCGERLAADPLGLARLMARLLDLDPRRLTQWLFARCIVGAPEWPELLGVAQQVAEALPS
jgi:streptomycin 6-kinase